MIGPSTTASIARANKLEAPSYFGDESWSDYTITLQARKLSGPEGFLIVFGHKNSDKFWWNVGGWGNREHAIESQSNRRRRTRPRPRRDRLAAKYAIKIQVSGRHIQCYLDGQLIHDVNVPARDRFFAETGRDDSTGDIILKAINVSVNPVAGDIDLKGVSQIKSGARVITLVLQAFRIIIPSTTRKKSIPLRSPGRHFQQSLYLAVPT